MKLATEMSRERNLMDAPSAKAPELPVSPTVIPEAFPKPSQLRLWMMEITQPDAPNRGTE